MTLTVIPDPTGAVPVSYQPDPEQVSYVSKFAVDTDGSGPLHGDPDAQADTSLHVIGKPLNADIDRYAVVPPQIIQRTRGIVLGCRGTATNIRTGETSDFVVGDIGPHTKIGEGSRALAMALGIDPSPTTGGTDEHIILWKLWPGQAAEGYKLQAC